MKGSRFWLPVVVLFVATPVCLFLGIASAGAGHGDYVLARILFPYTMLSAVAFDSITLPFTVMAVLQFPVYGVVLGAANVKSKLLPAMLGLLVLHCLTVLICFLLASENFS